MKRVRQSIKTFTIAILICTIAMAGGDVVNNGGGLSEQSLLYASIHFKKISDSCQLYKSCGAQGPLKDHLQTMNSCQKPETAQFKFSSDLNEDVVYEMQEQILVINRKKLYTEAHEALRIPEAFAFLTRIYLDFCGAVAFDQSKDLVKPIELHAGQQGEQITIGKESINLPKTQWIRVRSLYSDLLIETPEMLLRLSCLEDKLSSCSFNETGVSSSTKFRNLGLLSESIINGVVQFNIEGFLQTPQKKQRFSLIVHSASGVVKKVILDGQEMTLP